MLLSTEAITSFNEESHKKHESQLRAFRELHPLINEVELFARLDQFTIAIPSWALGTGGTRFGRFTAGGEPRSLEEKMEDVALLHRLTRSCGAISLHIPWDIPANARSIRKLAQDLELRFDAVNSNTFQDQVGQKHSYRYGSLAHADVAIRRQAIAHNQEVISYGKELGANVLSVWLSDGSNFPGQQNFARALSRTYESLQEIYTAMPAEFEMFLEYKPFEPNFYSTVIPDWGTSFLLCNKLGDRARVLVDLGHHLPNTNIEQIVATVLSEGKLGGFHFNDSRYADDDLTTGSIRPYQLYLIFLELVNGMNSKGMAPRDIGWMIDASHNVKDPLEDLLQAIDAISLAFIQAHLTDRDALEVAREENDPVSAQEILADAFRRDCRPLLAEYRRSRNGALHPLQLFRAGNTRSHLIKTRGSSTAATGL